MGIEALAVRVHELLAILEEEELLDTHHPAHAQIIEKVENLRLMALAHASAPLHLTPAQFDKDKAQNQQRKRKRDDSSEYSIGIGSCAQVGIWW
jgi:hypothetical protein